MWKKREWDVRCDEEHALSHVAVHHSKTLAVMSRQYAYMGKSPQNRDLYLSSHTPLNDPRCMYWHIQEMVEGASALAFIRSLAFDVYVRDH